MGEDLDIIFWAVAAAAAFLGEIFTVSFFLLFFCLGALAALVIAALGFGVGLQVVGFVAATVLSMAVLRPALVNRISLRGGERYQARGSIAGRSGVVTAPIEPGASGTVRIGSGEFWSARAVYPDQRIEAGARVRVLDTDGLTALVEPLEEEGGGKR
ncbi:hypothetical protein RxyAA322_30430 [Rubrobacter xylanophilus]|uniref:NfeD-like C-terminal domain-containing protein n=1 Tax=Rubrobacter xylanophilus TaxID=49319 RepID=A0A510HME1_9ACTN|nr:NfeD family protein [Rubrobacter xylanophilus]BBL81189.1 hypothetical protein RxyAA322_30430 [Rubrobacter xylanophilus]